MSPEAGPSPLARQVRRQFGRALYSPKRKGAPCPACGTWSPRSSTPGWVGAYRIRHHKCPRCGENFKSIEPDFTLD